MKHFLQENFKESTCFTPARGIHRNPIVVHAHEVNPVGYAIASIIGASLRDEEITISFAKMIYRIIKAQVSHYLLKIYFRDSINMMQSKKYIMPYHSPVALSDDSLVPKNKFG